MTIELAAITTSDPLDDSSAHTGTVVVECVFTVVDGEPTRARLVLVDDVITSMFVVEVTSEAVPLLTDEELHAAMPSIMTSNNGR